MEDNKTNNQSNQELAKTDDKSVASFGGLKFKSLADLTAWGETIVQQGFTPLKTGAAVVAAIMMGKELGLEPMVSVNNIHPINGRGTIGIHIAQALLSKAGVITEVIRDYEACVPFGMKGDDDLIYKGEDGKSAPIILRIGFADEEPRPNEVKGKSIVDWRTVIKMTRQLKQPDGTFKDVTMLGSYGISDATKAGLISRDNWVKRPKTMVKTRATFEVGRMIGDDVLLGMMETSEMLDTTDIPYTVTEDGKVTIIKTEEKPEVSNDNSHIEEVTPISEEKTVQE